MSKENIVTSYKSAEKEMKALLDEVLKEFSDAKKNNASEKELDNILYRYRGINEAYMREFSL